MRCSKAREDISLDLDGQLPPDRAAGLTRHLDDCGECRELPRGPGDGSPSAGGGRAGAVGELRVAPPAALEPDPRPGRGPGHPSLGRRRRRARRLVAQLRRCRRRGHGGRPGGGHDGRPARRRTRATSPITGRVAPAAARRQRRRPARPGDATAPGAGSARPPASARSPRRRRRSWAVGRPGWTGAGPYRSVDDLRNLARIQQENRQLRGLVVQLQRQLQGMQSPLDTASIPAVDVTTGGQ